MHLKYKSISCKKTIKNFSLVARLVQALVQAAAQVDVPQGAGKVRSNDRLAVTLEGHRLLVVPDATQQDYTLSKFLTKKTKTNKNKTKQKMNATHNSVPILSAIEVTQLWTICAGFSLQSFWLCALDAYLRPWYCNSAGTSLINTNKKTNVRQIFW